MIKLNINKPAALNGDPIADAAPKVISPKDNSLKDTFTISNTSKAFDKVEDFLNLGKSGRLDIGDLNEDEKKEFLKILASLLQKGIVGYEILEVNGKPEKHFIECEIGDQRIKQAKLYKDKPNKKII